MVQVLDTTQLDNVSILYTRLRWVHIRWGSFLLSRLSPWQRFRLRRRTGARWPGGITEPGQAPNAQIANNSDGVEATKEDLEAIKKAVDDAATVGGGLWLSYLFVLFYLAVASGAVMHADLLFERAVKLPFLAIELQLLAFFFIAPILFIIVHAYTLVHLVMLTAKAKRFHLALHEPGRHVPAKTRESLQWQLPSNIFIQFLAGSPEMRENAFGWLLRAIAWITLVLAPILLIILIQIQFLPFHSALITWTHRIAIVVDLVLLWWLWRKIVNVPEIGVRKRISSAATGAAALLLSFGIVLFSWAVATFPDEPQEKLLAVWDKKQWLVSVHSQVFNSEVNIETRRRRLPFSSTLVLPGLNVYEELGIDDPDKAKWRETVFHAPGRDLKGAIFNFSYLPKVDFTRAQLQGASLFGVRLQGALLDHARLQGASLQYAKLQGASLYDAHLEGASLDNVELQGASLLFTQFQGASLDGAKLEGASLDYATFDGASLAKAQLQGASLKLARLQGIDLSGTFLWRTNQTELILSDAARVSILGDAIRVSNVKLPPSTDTWRPIWQDEKRMVHAWRDEVPTILALVPEGRWRNEALDRIERLNCDNPDKELAPCDPSLPTPSEAAVWQKSIEDARVEDAAYIQALAAVLRRLVCSGDDDASYILLGLTYSTTRFTRIEATGSGAPALVDFILSRGCPVSASLSGDLRAKLLVLKQRAIERLAR